MANLFIDAFLDEQNFVFDEIIFKWDFIDWILDLKY